MLATMNVVIHIGDIVLIVNAIYYYGRIVFLNFFVFCICTISGMGMYFDKMQTIYSRCTIIKHALKHKDI